VLDARDTNIPHIHPGPYSKGSPRDVNKGILFLLNRLVPPTSDCRQQGGFVLILHKRIDAFLVDAFPCYRVLLLPPPACLLYVVIVLVLLLSVISSSVDCCALPRPPYATGGKKRPDWMFSFLGIGWSGIFCLQAGYKCFPMCEHHMRIGATPWVRENVLSRGVLSNSLPL
jgi:hypothetical protein